jgi:Sulfotransferase family
VQSQPLFIIGAPRSGTTFLCHALNRHPLIELTNECRIFVLIKQQIELAQSRPDLIDREFKDLFASFMRTHTGEMVEEFYRQTLGITAPIWGDKHPPYADPCVLSGRTGSRPDLPQSGSCLRLIRDTLPDAKFIHIRRDPVEVAGSLVRKGWTPSLEDGVKVWRQYVHEIETFFAALDPEQHITIAYEQLLTRPEPTSARIGRFLSLADWGPLTDFLFGQRQRPTPFSDPVSDLSVTYRRWSEPQDVRRRNDFRSYRIADSN